MPRVPKKRGNSLGSASAAVSPERMQKALEKYFSKYNVSTGKFEPGWSKIVAATNMMSRQHLEKVAAGHSTARAAFASWSGKKRGAKTMM